MTRAARRRTVDGTAPPFGGAAGRGQAPTVDGTAPPFGGAAGRGQAPTVDRRARPAAVAWLVLAVLTGAAHAAPITVGVFAPSAPFPSTAARVELANRLGGALGKALDGGVGRVYARAPDFAAAVRKTEVAIALVDPAYLAGTSGYTVIAVALHAGSADRGWQLVARTGTTLAALAGKRVVVPSLGGRELDFVRYVLLGGELARGFFAKVEAAPDTASALAALALGKTDAAVVPASGELPAGTALVLALPALPNPVLVVYGALPAASRDAVLAAALAFQGDATIAGFGAADGDLVRGVARRFTAPVKQPPFSVLAARHVVDDLADLIRGRGFAIERSPAATFAIAPAPR
jgi:ABC-type amino acid transport substrate-binding protein